MYRAIALVTARIGTAKPYWASGTNRETAPPLTTVTRSVRPRPRREVTAPVVSAPKRPPTAPAANTRPTVAGDRCRWRYAKIRNTAKNMLLPRLLVAVLPAIFHSVLLPKTT